MLLALLFVLGAVASVISSPTVSVEFPLDEQLPQIARVGQPYNWFFSRRSFSCSNGTLEYSTSSLPRWLTFDASNLTFAGMPSADDEESSTITVTATADETAAASSSFILHVTSSSPPQLQLPILEQFRPDNPSLASVFYLSPNSAIHTDDPTLRVPPGWSFSIGIMGKTFSSENDVYYEASLADGSPLPSWLKFDSNTITFDGVAPGNMANQPPEPLALLLHASDQKGYSSVAVPFNLVVASHELSSSSSLPTLNITASTSFNVSLSSPADFTGVLVDGKAIHPANITSLVIDTSPCDTWLKYDMASRTLSGDPPPDLRSGVLLPVTITTFFNQSLQTNMMIAIVPSFFSQSTLPPISAKGSISFNLAQFYSNATPNDDEKLSAVVEPSDAGSWLIFNADTSTLTGSVPSNASVPSVSVTFTAYSRITHSTSHASLAIDLSALESRKSAARHHPSGLSVVARRKLILGLSVVFGIVGGMVFIGLFLATLRRCARVRDTAVDGEEGMRAWSRNDRKWYGIADEDRIGPEYRGSGYGRTEKAAEGGGHDLAAPHSARPDPPLISSPLRVYGDIGLRRVATRTPSNPNTPLLSPSTAHVMRKGSFLEKIRQKVRDASDKYTRNVSIRKRPVIGKPALVFSTRASGSIDALPFEDKENRLLQDSRPTGYPFTDVDVGSFAASGATTLSGSPSSSTGGASIPTRRADLQTTPREPAMVHFADAQTRGARPVSTQSSSTAASNASVDTHAAEAVVYTASRATSVESGRVLSNQSLSPGRNGSEAAGPGLQARIMPFTKSSRVPAPGSGVNASSEKVSTQVRVASQRAKVVTTQGRDGEGDVDDDLAMGARYVKELGGDRKESSSKRRGA